MSIVTSEIFFIHEQPNGSAHILEHHVDSAGVTHAWHYTAAPGQDTDAALLDHAAALALRLAEDEASEVLS